MAGDRKDGSRPFPRALVPSSGLELRSPIPFPTTITVTPHASPSYYQVKGARGVMVIVVGNGHGDTSSNPGRG